MHYGERPAPCGVGLIFRSNLLTVVTWHLSVSRSFYGENRVTISVVWSIYLLGRLKERDWSCHISEYWLTSVELHFEVLRCCGLPSYVFSTMDPAKNIAWLL